jgi:hypothetical protein
MSDAVKLAEAVSLSEAEIAAGIENLRRKARPLMVSGLLVLLAAVVMGLIAGHVYGGGDNIPAPIIILYVIMAIAGLILLFTGNSIKKKLKRFVAENIIKSILGEAFAVESYEADEQISHDVIKDTQLIGGWEKSRGSDHLLGSYKSRKIEFSDMTLYYEEETTDSDGDTHTRDVIVFMGQWLICDFDKEVPSKLLIRENLVNLLGKYEDDGDDLDTEYVGFNEKFQILTHDAHTAFYVLTPHFMERILVLDQNTHGRLHLCFEGSRVHIAVNSGDLFEISTKAADYKDLDALRDRFRGEIRYLTDMLDILFSEENSGE